MNINIQRIETEYNTERCYVHARGLLLQNGFGLITMQKLELSGCDVFYGLEMRKTTDGGKHFSAPVPCQNLRRRQLEDGTSLAFCDATPFYHKRTGRILLTGHAANYGSNNKLLREPRRRSPLYAVYNEALGDFETFRAIEMPTENGDAYFSSGAGCTQIMEQENGELLIPIYYERQEPDAPRGTSAAAVMRCAFDGEQLRVLEIGTPLITDVPRGFHEPSIVRHGGDYFLALRNDQGGFIAKSRDGLHFDTPRALCFDDGESLGNYNTQQHWLTGGGRLWLVYTRRAGHNDHIFRHRAPLFIAQLDPARMCVIRATERIAVPERGARLGNFGCQSYSDKIGYVFAAEWMQNDPLGYEACAARGSDNSIFLSQIIY